MNFINDWSIGKVQSHLNATLKSKFTVLSHSVAGAGNMNYTYRIKTKENKNFIIKQSPPYCAKFPNISAPKERIFSERVYYNLVNQSQKLKPLSPEILGIDESQNIMYMTDLGEGNDYETLYDLNSPRLSAETLEMLIKYLVNLHSLEIDSKSTFKNTSMRELNFDYIFKLPFEAGNSAIDLDLVTPGLQSVANVFKENNQIKNEAKNLGEIYWKDTRTLIHGDFYPRSWLETENGLFIIDPEFAFLGVPEFDLSVFLAHMAMSNSFNTPYLALKCFYGDYNEELIAKLTAIEVFRRVIYVSQLPLHNTLHFKKELLDRSKEALLTGSINPFFGAIDV